jgi:hypothetical protein
VQSPDRAHSKVIRELEVGRAAPHSHGHRASGESPTGIDQVGRVRETILNLNPVRLYNKPETGFGRKDHHGWTSEQRRAVYQGNRQGHVLTGLNRRRPKATATERAVIRPKVVVSSSGKSAPLPCQGTSR